LSLNGVGFRINAAPTNVEAYIAIFRATQRLERFHERAKQTPHLWIVRAAQQDTDGEQFSEPVKTQKPQLAQ
jgi:hypothetical protein